MYLYACIYTRLLSFPISTERTIDHFALEITVNIHCTWFAISMIKSVIRKRESVNWNSIDSARAECNKVFYAPHIVAFPCVATSHPYRHYNWELSQPFPSPRAGLLLPDLWQLCDEKWSLLNISRHKVDISSAVRSLETFSPLLQIFQCFDIILSLPYAADAATQTKIGYYSMYSRPQIMEVFT